MWKGDCELVSRLESMELSIQKRLNDLGIYIPFSKMMLNITVAILYYISVPKYVQKMETQCKGILTVWIFYADIFNVT